MSMDVGSFLTGSGAKSLKFPDVGTEHTLTLIEEPELRQQTDFDSGVPLFWDDAKTQPRMQLVLTGTVEESEREDAEDTLERRLYVKGELQKALGEAMREAKVKAPAVGGRVWVKYTGNGTSPGRGKNPPKLYKAAYKAPEGGTAAFLGTSQAKTDDQPPF